MRGWLLNRENYKVGGLIGYQQTKFSWTAKGGYFNYDKGAKIGYFSPGEKSIGYKQQFDAPYIGLLGYYTVGDFEFNAIAKYSDRVRAKDHDEHYMRGISFDEKSNKAKLYSASVGVGYYLTPEAKVFTEFAYTKYNADKADTSIKDNSTGQSTFTPDSAGLDNKHYTLSVGLTHMF